MQIKKSDSYVARLADSRLKQLLGLTGAVVVEGPKWCGKTWLARHQAESEVLLQDPMGNYRNRRLAREDPAVLLSGAKPRLIDEWQDAPGIWDAVRIQVDREPVAGQFILTGSSTPREDSYSHSGTGRMSRLRLLPMSSAETGFSTAHISLAKLFAGHGVASVAGAATAQSLSVAIVRGGWPAVLGRSDTDALELARQYLTSLIYSDASRLDGARRDPERLAALVASLARNSATIVTNATLGRDMVAVSEISAASNTITDYLGVLVRLHVLLEIPAWAPALRSPIRLRESPKRMLVDPSLTVAALGADAESVAADGKTAGFLFESMCLRDLSVYADANGLSLSHYRDNTNLEVDAILSRRSGQWAAIEIKWSAEAEDQAAASLIRLRNKMMAAGEREPVFLAVLVGLGEFARVRPDGVVVIPCDTLGA